MQFFVNREQYKALHIKLDLIIKEQCKTMAAIDDLKKAVSDISTAISAAVAKITNPSSTDADVEAAAQELEALAQSLNNAVNPPAPIPSAPVA